MLRMLEVKNLHRMGLKPTSFALASGSCLAVRGASGAGKTLLLRAIADLDPNQGQVFLDGAERSAMSGPEWRRKVVFLPAQPGWWADTVGSHFTDWGRAVPLLDRLRLPAKAAQWSVSRCSTGELSRLALLRALLCEPRVLLLDEPTSALDSDSVAAVESLVSEHLETGMSALWTTHDAAQAARVAQRSLTVAHGVVCEVPDTQ